MALNTGIDSTSFRAGPATVGASLGIESAEQSLRRNVEILLERIQTETTKTHSEEQNPPNITH